MFFEGLPALTPDVCLQKGASRSSAEAGLAPHPRQAPEFSVRFR